VLTRNGAIDHLNEVFVVLATTNIRGLATEVALGPADGMPRTCVLNADHVASLPKGYLGELITTLGAERLDQVCRAPDHALLPARPPASSTAGTTFVACTSRPTRLLAFAMAGCSFTSAHT